MLQRKTTARQNEARMALGNCKCDSGGDESPATMASDDGIFTGMKVDSRISLVGKLGQWQTRVELFDGDLQHTENLRPTV